MNNLIVAEITRNWEGGDRAGKPLVSQQFEEIIRVNDERGYDLESWQFQTGVIPGSDGVRYPSMFETIIAVFRKRK